MRKGSKRNIEGRFLQQLLMGGEKMSSEARQLAKKSTIKRRSIAKEGRESSG